MRIKKRFKGIALVALLAVAGLFGISTLGSNSYQSSTKEAQAADINMATLYVRIKEGTDRGDSGYWHDGNVGALYAAFYDSNGSVIGGWKNHPMEGTITRNNTTYGYVTVPSNAKNVIIHTGENQTNQNAQTQEYVLPEQNSGYNTFTVNTNNGWWGNKQEGFWGCLDDLDSRTAFTVNSGDTFFLDMKGWYRNWNGGAGWKNDSAWFALSFTNNPSEDVGSGIWTDRQYQTSTYRGDIFKFTVPSGGPYSYVQAIRCGQNTGRWNGTGFRQIITNCIAVTPNTSLNDAYVFRTVYGLKSGNSFFINTNNVDWWVGDSNSHPFVYFYDAQDGSSALWSTDVVKYVNDNSAEETDDHLYEVTVPGDGKTFYGVIAIRGKDSTGSWNVYNQTTDFNPISTTEDCVQNAIVIKSDVDSSSHNYINWEYSYHITNEARGEMFGRYFASQMNGLCISDGSTDPSTLITAWTNLKDEYDHISNSTQGYIWNRKPTTEGLLDQALIKYDYIVFYKQYDIIGSDTDFIGRDDSSGRVYSSISPHNIYSLIGNEDSSITTIIVILASSVSLLSITALSVFLVKKRKTKQSN